MSVQPLPKTAIEPGTSIGLDQHIVICWRVARAALGEVALAGKSPIVHLEFALSPSLDFAWVLIDPQHEIKHIIEPKADGALIRITGSASSIEIESPHLSAHILMPDQGSPQLVYVRTDIFAQLQIPGGRYEPIGCSIRL